MTGYTERKSIEKLAQVGLIAKGIVYVLVGFIAFFAAFNIGNRSENVSQDSAFSFVEDLPAGNLLLWALAVGLLCYSAWRMIQTFRKSDGEQIKTAKRFRYFFSGLAYLLLTFSVVRFALDQGSGGGDKNQKMAGEMMTKPFGTWLVLIAGLIFAAVGIYQIWYGLSEKYKKHVQSFNLHTAASTLLLRSGKIGYVARGVVWLLISYMLTRAGLHHNSSEAGSTDKAFQILENSMGPYIAGVLGLGLVAYGIFSFIRARYDRFG
jgi:hypothetical protein